MWARATARRGLRIRPLQRFSGPCRRPFPGMRPLAPHPPPRDCRCRKTPGYSRCCRWPPRTPQIIAFEEKYKRPHWRPITAIRAATDLNIAALKGDTGWEPLLVTPPHPEYPSAHATFSGAAEAVLRGFFGNDEVDVSVTAPGPFGVTRTYHKFSELTEEVDNARVWGGIHFRSADVDGAEIGRKIGDDHPP